jgi:hypothetical protein
MALLTGALKDVYDSLRKRDAEQKELIDRISRDVASLRAELAMKNFQAGGGLTAQQVCSRIQEALSCFEGNPPLWEMFTVSSGDDVTIAGDPNPDFPIVVFRNGILQEEGAANDYTISGGVVTFNVPFGVSGNAANTEKIAIHYFN